MCRLLCAALQAEPRHGLHMEEADCCLQLVCFALSLSP